MTDKELLIKCAERAYRAAIEGKWADATVYMDKGVQLIDMS